MRTIQFRRTAAAAAGLAIVGGGVLGAGIASAGGDTTAPKPGAPICGTTGINGQPHKIVPCSQVPTTGAGFTIAPDGTITDSTGKVVGKYDPKTGTVTGNGPGAKPGVVTGPTGAGGNGQGVIEVPQAK
ncbi:hypothetical protein [Tsukamurella pseudospumae]|uniref:Uncharacterized protein n=1 Tax=Tsukamurella pseudospumae TaxID=239498 RepID=A0A137YX00_9ACTN|nr:hypothetical protein [Tsukamurella pseudospumae]KXO90470.1 hypothetical protein AXK61_07575 [Tsukamurella pseudospumae]